MEVDLDNADEFHMESRRRLARMSLEEQNRHLERLAVTVAEENEAEAAEELTQEPFEAEANDDEDWLPDDASDAGSELQLEFGEEEVDDEDEEVIDEIIQEAVQGEQQEVDRASPSNTVVARDGSVWNTIEPPTSRIRAHCILREEARVAPGMIHNPIDIWRRIMSVEMCNIIICETNRKAEETMRDWNEKHPNSKPKTWKALTAQELDAYIGLLLAAGVSLSAKQHSKELWQTNALPIFRATMSLKRFWEITRFIRFDNGNTRREREKTDKAAAIRDIWEMLNVNLKSAYTPGDSITIDEQLFPYRGRTRFTQYMPSKPAKYGLKICWACDAVTKFPLKGILYTGRNRGEPRERNQGERVVRELALNYENSGRTIVANNFFITLPLAKELITKRLAFVGTLRKNKRYIPSTMLPNATRETFSTEFLFHQNDVALISYVPKKRKAVLLLSTMHYTKEVLGPQKKAKAILYYNSHKSGVDTMNQMLGNYSCKRRVFKVYPPQHSSTRRNFGFSDIT